MQEKILVVDDDPDILDALTMILESQGYQVVTARDGVEGLANLKAENPALVVLDLLMPKMNGFEVTTKLRENPAFSHTPIIALTAHAMKGDRERVIESGAIRT